jgi:hypothetical protein
MGQYLAKNEQIVIHLSNINCQPFPPLSLSVWMSEKILILFFPASALSLMDIIMDGSVWTFFWQIFSSLVNIVGVKKTPCCTIVILQGEHQK